MPSQEFKDCVGGLIKINLHDLHEFQGDLKDISEENLDSLKFQIKENGFSSPFFVWKKSKKWYILDGHQRKTALISLEGDGYKIPELPAIEILADDEHHAKKILLSVSSQFGEFNTKSLRSWMDEIGDVLSSNLRLVDTEINFNLDFSLGLEDNEEEERDENARTVHICPSCGHEF
jgi:hypothetical protein